MLDLRWGQNGVGDVLLVVEVRLFLAESCVYTEWCYLFLCSTRAPKNSSTLVPQEAVIGQLGLLLLEVPALRREVIFIQMEFQRVQLTERRCNVLY